MIIDVLELKKERLDEVRKQLKKYLQFQYNCAAANMLKAERDKLKVEIKEIEVSEFEGELRLEITLDDSKYKKR